MQMLNTGSRMDDGSPEYNELSAMAVATQCCTFHTTNHLQSH
jgi:hypothetical protein